MISHIIEIQDFAVFGCSHFIGSTNTKHLPQIFPLMIYFITAAIFHFQQHSVSVSLLSCSLPTQFIWYKTSGRQFQLFIEYNKLTQFTSLFHLEVAQKIYFLIKCLSTISVLIKCLSAICLLIKCLSAIFFDQMSVGKCFFNQMSVAHLFFDQISAAILFD